MKQDGLVWLAALKLLICERYDLASPANLIWRVPQLSSPHPREKQTLAEEKKRRLYQRKGISATEPAKWTIPGWREIAGMKKAG